jgi:hypothetical protein
LSPNDKRVCLPNNKRSVPKAGCLSPETGGCPRINKGLSPKQQEVCPQRQDVRSQRQGVCPRINKGLSPNERSVPKDKMSVPRDRGCPRINRGLSPNQQRSVSQTTRGLSPKTRCPFPETGVCPRMTRGSVSQTTRGLSPKQDVCPQRQGVVPESTKVCLPNNKRSVPKAGCLSPETGGCPRINKRSISQTTRGLSPKQQEVYPKDKKAVPE